MFMGSIQGLGWYGTPQNLLGSEGIPKTYDHADEEGDIKTSNTEYKDKRM